MKIGINRIISGFTCAAGLVAAFLSVSSIAVAENCASPATYLTHSLVLPANGSGSGLLTAEIKNNSASCTTKVGVATYKSYDNNIENDAEYDYSVVILGPGQSQPFTGTSVPSCAYRAFLFFGDYIPSFKNGVRYGNRTLTTVTKAVAEGYPYCSCGCKLPTPTPTPTGTPGTPSCNANVGAAYTAECKPGTVAVELKGSGNQVPGGVTYQWTTNCPSGTFNDATLIDPVLTFVPANQNNMPVSCSVDLTVNGLGGKSTSCSAPVGVGVCTVDCKGVLNGNSKVDRCGVCDGDGQSCVNCDNTNIASTQLTLDNSALKKRNNVFKSSKIMAEAYRKNAKISALAKKINEEASVLYESCWVTTYSLPSEVLSCQESPFCVQVSTAPVVQTYSSNSNRFVALIQGISKTLKKGPKSSYDKVQKLLKKTQDLVKQDETTLSQIPSSQSSCS